MHVLTHARAHTHSLFHARACASVACHSPAVHSYCSRYTDQAAWLRVTGQSSNPQNDRNRLIRHSAVKQSTTLQFHRIIYFFCLKDTNEFVNSFKVKTISELYLEFRPHYWQPHFAIRVYIYIIIYIFNAACLLDKS